MKLGDFLDLATKSGQRVELRGPTERILASMSADALTAEQWEALARTDAAGLPRRPTPYEYHYEARAEGTDGRAPTSLAHTLRAHGGAEGSAGEVSDVVPMPVVKDSATALGHVVKGYEQLAKQVVALASRLADRERDEVRELRGFAVDMVKEVRRLHGKMGEGDVVVQIAKAHADAEGRSRDNLAGAIRGVAPLAAALVAPMLPEGARGKAGQGLLLAMLRTEQLEGIYELIGVRRASALLTAKTREEMTAAILAIDGETELPKILDLLDVAQRAMVNRMLDEVLKGAPTEAAAQ